jgi:hypothetical protein
MKMIVKQRSINLDDLNLRRGRALAHENATSLSGLVRNLIAQAWEAKQAKRAAEEVAVD